LLACRKKGRQIDQLRGKKDLTKMDVNPNPLAQRELKIFKSSCMAFIQTQGKERLGSSNGVLAITDVNPFVALNGKT